MFFSFTNFNSSLSNSSGPVDLVDLIILMLIWLFLFLRRHFDSLQMYLKNFIDKTLDNCFYDEMISSNAISYKALF